MFNEIMEIMEIMEISCGPGVLNGLKTVGLGEISLSVELFHFCPGALGDTTDEDWVFLPFFLPRPLTGLQNRFRAVTDAEFGESECLNLFSGCWLVLGTHSSSEDSTKWLM